MQGIIKTIKVVRTGDIKNAKRVNVAHVSALQGEQVDKLLKAIRDRVDTVESNSWDLALQHLRPQWRELWQTFTWLYAVRCTKLAHQID